MKSSLVLAALIAAPLTFAQTTPPASGSSQTSATPASNSPAANQLRVRGPEAVAEKEPDKVVAVINGKSITAKEAANLLKAIPPDQLKKYESNLSNVLQQIYMGQQLAGEAVKMNLDQQSPWKEQLQLTRDNILTQAYLNKLAGNAPAGAAGDPQQYYSSHPQEFDRIKLSGIFVSFNPPGTPAGSAANNRTEEQARTKADDLEKKIQAGGDFSTLARTDNDNQQAAARGGELGTFNMADTQLPPDLKTALGKLQAGQVSEPIRIPSGFLIVKVDSKNKLTFDQARPEIIQNLQKERTQTAVKQQIDKYKIQVQDPDFFSMGAAQSNIPSLAHPAAAGARPGASPVQH